MSNLKYYAYTSQTKIDMLFSQIPLTIRDSIEAEVKLKTPLAEISFSKKQIPDNLYIKLDTTIDYLEKQAVIGSIGKPLEYFKGILHMGWAQIYPGVVFFGCKLNNSIVGLGGSMNNLLGYKWDVYDIPIGVSHTPWLVSLLYKEIEMLLPFDPVIAGYKIAAGSVYDLARGGLAEYEKRVASATQSWAQTLQMILRNFKLISLNL